MTKRNFLRSMLLATVAPQVLVAAAEDRYRWKVNASIIGDGISHRPGFKPADYFGKWRFVEYRKLPSGLWQASSDGFVSGRFCYAPSKDAIAAPYLELVAPMRDAEMIFHLRGA